MSNQHRSDNSAWRLPSIPVPPPWERDSSTTLRHPAQNNRIRSRDRPNRETIDWRRQKTYVSGMQPVPLIPNPPPALVIPDSNFLISHRPLLSRLTEEADQELYDQCETLAYKLIDFMQLALLRQIYFNLDSYPRIQSTEQLFSSSFRELVEDIGGYSGWSRAAIDNVARMYDFYVAVPTLEVIITTDFPAQFTDYLGSHTLSKQASRELEMAYNCHAEILMSWSSQSYLSAESN
ncbi:hypothetical protein M422DRAFT_70393 [Sphaerobolus stellatus SS14]|uniref:Uncharacterized protein n=1 Tax=Sphaerobolus stellatus (strain SS14) TaxID=990650 RepID=A0A0C9UFK3_SPHS4|nr:hypothetical protein M422DRAFT_70393 [Sphaerobolus stellatus SS14]